MENDESQLFGIHAVMEAIKSGKTIDKIFLQKGLQGELSRELILLLREHKIVPNTVPIEKLNLNTMQTTLMIGGGHFGGHLVVHHFF